jgi:hypothetical protein
LIQHSVTFEGAGLAKANVSWQASGGTVSPSLSSTDISGRATRVFKPIAGGLAKITALITHPGIGDENLTTTAVVTPTYVRPPPSMVDQILIEAPVVHVPYIVIAGAAAAVLLVAITFLRRRGKAKEVVAKGYCEASAS